MEGALKFVIANWETIRTLAEIGLSLIVAVVSLNASARGAIAAVYKIMKEGLEMTPEQRLQKASDLMGKKCPYIPENLRKMIIQFVFDSIPKVAQNPKV